MKKQKIDLLIKDGIIITVNQGNDVLMSGSLAIRGSEIVALGSTKELLEKFEIGEEIDAKDHIVMPGLIDTHFHTAQQFERNLISYLKKENHPKEPFWKYALVPFEDSLSDEDIFLSAELGYANMLKVGTTCFADPGGPKPELMAPALEEIGLRGILARSTMDASQDIPEGMQDTIEGIIDKGERLYRDWNGKADGRIRVWMAMRQILVCSDELIKEIGELASRLETGIHIHLAEASSEVDFAINNYGVRPAQYLASIEFLGPNVLAAHSSLLNDDELDIYQGLDVSVAHCPAAAFGSTGPTKVLEMLRRGIRVGIGSDGAISSGGSLDLFRQIAISRYALRILFGHPYKERTIVKDSDFLRMATIGGANAINWGSDIGSLEVGKKADIILISLDHLDSLPSYDPINTIASVIHGSNVDTVLVNGEVIMRDRKLLKIDEKELKERVKERTPIILKRFLQSVERRSTNP